jgi:hypothetical protein
VSGTRSGRAVKKLLDPYGLVQAEKPVCSACGRSTQGWLWFCYCSCGEGVTHGVCLECLEAGQEIGLIETAVTTLEADMEAGPPIKRQTKSYMFQRCPRNEEVRTALAMGR